MNLFRNPLPKTFACFFNNNINSMQSYVFMYSGSLSSNFFNYKIQSKRITVKCSHNTKTRFLEENSCLLLLTMYYWKSHSSI